MEFNKYNYSNDNITIGSYSSSNNSTSTTSSDTPISRGGSDSISRVIWGNYDDGGNIEDSMKINGNIYINKTSDSEDDDSDDYEWCDTEEEEQFDYDWDDDTEGGSLYVENNVKAKSVEATEVYGKKLFVNYPNSNSNKENVADLIKSNADRITTNTTNITNLTTTVNGHTTQINANTANIATNTTNISTNTSEIAELKEKYISEDRIKELINELLPTTDYNGGYNNPVVLFSGGVQQIYDGNYWVSGSTNPNFTITLKSVENGLMTLELTNNNDNDAYIYARSISVHQSKTTATEDITQTSLKGRSAGAHWFETRYNIERNKTTIYIREFHEGDQNNDTWESNYWGNIKEINLTICGYYYMMPT